MDAQQRTASGDARSTWDQPFLRRLSGTAGARSGSETTFYESSTIVKTPVKFAPYPS